MGILLPYDPSKSEGVVSENRQPIQENLTGGKKLYVNFSIYVKNIHPDANGVLNEVSPNRPNRCP